MVHQDRVPAPLTTIPSAFPAKETMDRLEAAVRTKGLTVFARIDHAAGAAAAGLPLRPTELLVFGNARAGTPLMQVDQRVGIELPLKTLVWQDPAGQVWLAYEEPRQIAARHALGAEVDAVTAQMSTALVTLAQAAAGRS
jgi:uncharacterized protein (DUF302 family)